MTRNRILALLLLLGCCVDLHAAYIDPASTSTLLQVLAPVFIVFSLLGGFIKRGFLRLVGRSSQAPQEDEAPESEPEPKP